MFYFIVQAVDKYIVPVDKSESDFEAQQWPPEAK